MSVFQINASVSLGRKRKKVSNTAMDFPIFPHQMSTSESNWDGNTLASADHILSVRHLFASFVDTYSISSNDSAHFRKKAVWQAVILNSHSENKILCSFRCVKARLRLPCLKLLTGTAVRTSFQDSQSYVTFLFSEWRILTPRLSSSFVFSMFVYIDLDNAFELPHLDCFHFVNQCSKAKLS